MPTSQKSSSVSRMMRGSPDEVSVDELVNTAVAGGIDEGTALDILQGKLDSYKVMRAAHEARLKIAGEHVTFVVNRNINFTNVCINRCRFCAFRRDPDDSDAYRMTPEEVGERAAEARDAGATEVCLQGGLHPEATFEYYLEMLDEIKSQAQDIHVHGYSPMEVKYCAKLAGEDIEDVLRELKRAGLDSMPGTAAEIFSSEVRKRLCPDKLEADEWEHIIRTAHELGIPTTCTMMYGHIDSPRDWIDHMKRLRRIQEDTGGFTEFVPLSFVHSNAPIYRRGGARPGVSGMTDVLVHAVARLYFGPLIPNIQASWVKLGVKLAQMTLHAGANDLGGTLMEENISREAGAKETESLEPEEIVEIIREAGFTPVQRTTLYEPVKVY
ncbi:5-amino-6-(D-ribitylamino)uracil--L-tyrosine 4-hydroxyphenyl transferase CofH [Methanopyrus sp.]